MTVLTNVLNPYAIIIALVVGIFTLVFWAYRLVILTLIWTANRKMQGIGKSVAFVHQFARTYESPTLMMTYCARYICFLTVGTGLVLLGMSLLGIIWASGKSELDSSLKFQLYFLGYALSFPGAAMMGSSAGALQVVWNPEQVIRRVLRRIDIEIAKARFVEGAASQAQCGRTMVADIAANRPWRSNEGRFRLPDSFKRFSR